MELFRDLADFLFIVAFVIHVILTDRRLNKLEDQ